MLQKISALLITFIFIGSCQGKGGSNETVSDNKKIGERRMDINITSQSFAEGDMIPKRYTCDGENVSPPLAWTLPPIGMKSYALICDDPDAPMGTWVHWVLFNLPADSKELHENIPPQEILENGAKHGINDFRKIGYGGPCPPSGTHRYYFKMYALDIELDLESGITKQQLLQAMKGHILAEGKLMGKYKR